MKTNLKNIGLLFLAAFSFISCDNNDHPAPAATPAQFAAVREAALEAQTQKFTATAGAGVITLTSAKGVTITLNGNCLIKNGLPVTGAIDIEFVELFDKGTMLVTNKPTMGIMPNGDRALLISGGEFFINATQGGVNLVPTCNINLNVPAALTDGVDNAMTLWNGIIDEKGNLAWADARDTAGANGGKGGVEAGQNNYYVSFGNFGWTNVDKFYSDPRPRTTILAAAPAGYDNTNSAIYLSYDGEGTNALAKLDTYTAAGLFSEHYGQIPIGLACHVIFATEDNGQWRYAIKAVTVQANDVYTFTMGETTVGTEAQLVAAINAIQ
ncbi:hypothetical protein SLW70_02075 [Flavobacterium sp. NG2]|uniref:hypothetical protein n=1 Tax=Flavobacterium sp. NG2 TaxID=3097547 RepID=UPI002A7ED9A6|nr:hypothetical protein [Flavobacterium sp. NG2]WPR71940.1 hypothetical protein SLW70_02075 [Flavobacterium sp. NG2]